MGNVNRSLQGTTLWNTFCSIGLAALLQLVLGAPFLYTNAWGYISMSFDLGARLFDSVGGYNTLRISKLVISLAVCNVLCRVQRFLAYMLCMHVG